VSKKKAAPARVRAIGYIRVSSRQQKDEGLSLGDQREEIMRYCAVAGLDLIDIHEDGGISGAKDETARPGLAAALAALREGLASVLVVKHVDRLSRDNDFAGFLKVELRRIGVRVEIIDEAKDDPIRQAVDQLAAALERIRGSQRMKFSHRMRRSKGIWTGGAPYGYSLVSGKLEPIEREQAVIIEVCRLRDSGLTFRAIAEVLNGEAVPTRTGRPWSHQTVHHITKREYSSATLSPFLAGCASAVPVLEGSGTTLRDAAGYPV
jgi:DNA invertase Pin-like site-specific DNA recombinase